MNDRYVFGSKERKRLVREQTVLNGIDYLEVASNPVQLVVRFLLPVQGANSAPPGGPTLTHNNFIIEGGVRIIKVAVIGATPAGSIITLDTDKDGDFSTYTLRLVNSEVDLTTPRGYDPQLCSVEFSFKATCPDNLDCQTDCDCVPEKVESPDIDYLVKDYTTFRRLMLDRMSVVTPGWTERNPADEVMTIVEALAYVADHLSYYQDAAATESIFGTARKRISSRRHARLLDYVVHSGCNSRAWVHLDVAAGSAADHQPISKGTVFLTQGPDEKIQLKGVELDAVIASQAPVIFQTLHNVTIHSNANRISFYTWSDTECSLLKGSTRATLLNTSGLALSPGDVLIFEEQFSATKGSAADADKSHRHPVRLTRTKESNDPLTGLAVIEIEWHAEDELPFDLCISSSVTTFSNTIEQKEIAFALGNNVLVDCGRPFKSQPLMPGRVPLNGNYRPKLVHKGVICTEEYGDDDVQKPASTILLQDPRKALPNLSLSDGMVKWMPVRDLLASARSSREFVAEEERDGSVTIRFGDGLIGGEPSPSAKFVAEYRIGNGRYGNVGADTICRIVDALPGITCVRNPMIARGGIDSETMEEIRQFAPKAFRIQERAVSEDDYARKAELHPQVQRAMARFRWTGSWFTVFVYIDRVGGLPVDSRFRLEMVGHLNKFRMAGYDLHICGPQFVPLDLALEICVKPGHVRAVVEKTLLRVLGSRLQRDGRRGFFHPDNFTFGQSLQTSRIIAAVMNVEGVLSTTIVKFQRHAKIARNEIADGVMPAEPLEILRLDNDKNFLENGVLTLTMYGGL